MPIYAPIPGDLEGPVLLSSNEGRRNRPAAAAAATIATASSLLLLVFRCATLLNLLQPCRSPWCIDLARRACQDLFLCAPEGLPVCLVTSFPSSWSA